MIGGVYGHYLARDLRLGINFRVNRESCLLIGVTTMPWRHHTTSEVPATGCAPLHLIRFSFFDIIITHIIKDAVLFIFLVAVIIRNEDVVFMIPSGTAY